MDRVQGIAGPSRLTFSSPVTVSTSRCMICWPNASHATHSVSCASPPSGRADRVAAEHSVLHRASLGCSRLGVGLQLAPRCHQRPRSGTLRAVRRPLRVLPLHVLMNTSLVFLGLCMTIGSVLVY